MGLEDFTSVESSEEWNNSSEISEKYKEASKKAAAWVKRTQKDEKKAKKYDFLLARFLVQIILEKQYDIVLSDLFKCLEKWYATNFLLGVLSLIYLPISNEIRRQIWKDLIKFNFIPYQQELEFDDNNIDESVRKRINQWIDDIEGVIFLEPSSISTSQTISLLKNDDTIINFTSLVFSFFLGSIWFKISEKKSRSYAEFILSQLEKTLQSLDLEKI